MRGDTLALLGSSGGTDFPHLHYALRRFGATVNPFTAVSPTGCEAPEAGSLWAAEHDIQYIGSAQMGFGVTGDFPSLEALSKDRAALDPPEGASAPVYIWHQLLGAQAGDSLRLVATAPDGQPVANEVFRVDQDTSVLVTHIGITPEDLDLEEWPRGVYTARVALYAGTQEVLRDETLFSPYPEDISAEDVTVGGDGNDEHRQGERENQRQAQHAQ